MKNVGYIRSFCALTASLPAFRVLANVLHSIKLCNQLSDLLEPPSAYLARWLRFTRHRCLHCLPLHAPCLEHLNSVTPSRLILRKPFCVNLKNWTFEAAFTNGFHRHWEFCCHTFVLRFCQICVLLFTFLCIKRATCIPTSVREAEPWNVRKSRSENF